MVGRGGNHRDNEPRSRRIADDPDRATAAPRVGIAHDPAGIACGFKRPLRFDARCSGVTLPATPDVVGILVTPPQIIHHVLHCIATHATGAAWIWTTAHSSDTRRTLAVQRPSRACGHCTRDSGSAPFLPGMIAFGNHPELCACGTLPSRAGRVPHPCVWMWTRRAAQVAGGGSVTPVQPTGPAALVPCPCASAPTCPSRLAPRSPCLPQCPPRVRTAPPRTRPALTSPRLLCPRLWPPPRKPRFPGSVGCGSCLP